MNDEVEATVFDLIGSLGSGIAEAEELLGIGRTDPVKCEEQTPTPRIEELGRRLIVLRDRMIAINEQLRRLGN